MDLQAFLQRLPQEYQDWGSPFMAPLSQKFSVLRERTASSETQTLFPLLNLAVACLGEGEVYCQVGCFGRGSLVSALLGHSTRSGYGVEAFFKYDPSGEKLALLSQDIEAFNLEDSIFLSDQETESFFEDLRELEIEEKIGVYYYDAAKDYRSVLMALMLAKDFWSNSALIIINKVNDSQNPAGHSRFFKNPFQCAICSRQSSDSTWNFRI